MNRRQSKRAQHDAFLTMALEGMARRLRFLDRMLEEARANVDQAP